MGVTRLVTVPVVVGRAAVEMERRAVVKTERRVAVEVEVEVEVELELELEMELELGARDEAGAEAEVEGGELTPLSASYFSSVLYSERIPDPVEVVPDSRNTLGEALDVSHCYLLVSAPSLG